MSMKWPAEIRLLMLAALLASVAAGCRQKMADQPAYRPLQQSDFWGDDRSARAPGPGTVARGQLREDEATFTGKRGEAFVNVVPLPVNRAVLDRGRERYAISCSPCHDPRRVGPGTVAPQG